MNQAMNQEIHYKTSSASYEDILKHLWFCDENHHPKLSERLDMDNYARKIFGKSVTFEAWSKNDLIGLIAAYLDDEKQGFITNVSVSSEHMKKGIAKALIQHCINAAISKRIYTLSLEVSHENNAAIKLYKKLGFEKPGLKTGVKNFSHSTPSITMILNLKGQSSHE